MLKKRAIILGLSALFSFSSFANVSGYFSMTDFQQVNAPTDTTDIVVLLNGSGQIASAYNIPVNGQTWDVAFIDATVEQMGQNIAAGTQAEATNFANAIIDNLLVDNTLGSFDADYTLVAGCEAMTAAQRCGLYTPFFYGYGEDPFGGGLESYLSMDGVSARNVDGDQDIYGNQEIATFNGFSEFYSGNVSNAYILFANWTVSASPEPEQPQEGNNGGAGLDEDGKVLLPSQRTEAEPNGAMGNRLRALSIGGQ